MSGSGSGSGSLFLTVSARKRQAKLLKKMSFTKQDSEETNSVITDGGSQVRGGRDRSLPLFASLGRFKQRSLEERKTSKVHDSKVL